MLLYRQPDRSLEIFTGVYLHHSAVIFCLLIGQKVVSDTTALAPTPYRFYSDSSVTGPGRFFLGAVFFFLTFMEGVSEVKLYRSGFVLGKKDDLIWMIAQV